MNPLCRLGLAPPEQAPMQQLRRILLEVDQDEQQPIFRGRQGTVLISGIAARLPAPPMSYSPEFSGGAPTPFVIPLNLFSLTPILGHQVPRPSDLRVTHAQHSPPDPRKPDHHR
jgi:hypothetical protein